MSMATHSRFYRNWAKTQPKRGPDNRKTLKSEVALLKRRVNQNTAEVINHRAQFAVSPLSAITLRTDNLTDLFLATTDYRDNILGDTYRNKSLQMRLQTPPEMTNMRVIIYKPKKVTGSISFGQSNAFTEIVDPNAFRVFLDRTISPISALNQHHEFRVNFGNLMTEYNSANTQLEKGVIKILFITQGTTQQYRYGYDHKVQNK